MEMFSKMIIDMKKTKTVWVTQINKFIAFQHPANGNQWEHRAEAVGLCTNRSLCDYTRCA